MPDARTIFAWIVEIESTPDPVRRDSLRNGYSLAQLAASDSLVSPDEQGFGQLAMVLGELHQDGWLRWDWQTWPGDREPVNGRMYQSQHLQRIDNLRATPAGLSALVARGRVAPPPSAATSSSVLVAESADPTAIGPETGEDLRDVFISHAGEDKADVARPLHDALLTRGHSAWFDEAELVVGASLSESIDWGLAHSRFGVVVLSRRFFAKTWPRRELQGLVAREMAGGERLILPVWHGIDQAYIAKVAPPLADLLAANTDHGVESVADEISRAIQHRRGLERARGRPLPARPAVATIEEEDSSSRLDLRDQLVGLLRADDSVGVRELLRAERRQFETGLVEVLAAAGDRMQREVDRDQLRELEELVWQLVERRSATLLPLVEYAPQRLPEELSALAALADRSVPTRSTMQMWRRSTRPAVWLVVYLLGAWATAEENWAVVRMLWDIQTADDRPLGVLAQQPAERLGEELARSRPNTAISSKAISLWHLGFRVAGSEFLVERYTELVRVPGDDDPVSACLTRVGNFSWLMTGFAGKYGVALDQWWRADQVKLTLPTRLERSGFRDILEQLFVHDFYSEPADLPAWIDRAPGRRGWA